MNRYVSFLAMLVICVLVCNVSQAITYTVTDLGTLGGSRGTIATGINNSGQIVGNSPVTDNPLHTHAFLYSSGKMIDLGTLGGTDSSASAINDVGQIVGSSKGQDGLDYCFRTEPYSPINPNTDDLGGGSASAINASGQVVGYRNTYPSAYRTAPNSPINWPADCLLDPYGYGNSVANGINDSGHVVGMFSPNGSGWMGFLYTSPTDPCLRMGSLGGGETVVNDINSNGQVVGASDIGGHYHAFRTSPYTPIAPATDDLGSLGGQSSAAAINNLGQAVGNSSLTPDRYPWEIGYTHAFLYSNSTMIDLNSLIDSASGWTLSEANDINDAGQIVGAGLIGGQTHAFLLTPVPEPSTLVILISALLGFGWIKLARWR